MPVRRPLAQGLAASLVFVIALLTVGLTGSATSPFSIVIRPVFVRLGIDVDVTLGTMHLHASWSALPESTKPAPDRF